MIFHRKTEDRAIMSELLYTNCRLMCRGAFQLWKQLWRISTAKIKVDTNSAIAYKGGHYERDLLASLNILSINLECFQCSKAEGLFDQLVWLETCGHHLMNDAYWHCTKVEVEGLRGMVAATALKERKKKTVLLRTNKNL